MPKGHPPTPQARLYAIPGANPNGVKHGKLTPADRPAGRIAPARYIPACIACGGPRGRTFGLRCPDCTPEAA